MKINCNQPYNGSSTRDYDWYRFELPSAGTVQVSLTNEQHLGGSSWSVNLTDAEGDTIEGFDWEESSTSHEGTVIGLPAGTYAVRVYGNTRGHTYTLKVSTVSPTQTMYRLYNQSLKSIGWTYEGVGWVAPASGDPVYRLFNPYSDDHHYTMKADERDALKKLGWRDEGVGWYSGGSVPVLRQFNPYAVTATHNYTVSKEENDALVRIGWRAEGTGWFAVRAE